MGGIVESVLPDRMPGAVLAFASFQLGRSH